MLTQDARWGTSTSCLHIIFQFHCCSSMLRFKLPFFGLSWKKLVLLLSAILIVLMIVTRPRPSGDLTTQGDFSFHEFWILFFCSAEVIQGHAVEKYFIRVRFEFLAYGPRY